MVRAAYQGLVRDRKAIPQVILGQSFLNMPRSPIANLSEYVNDVDKTIRDKIVENSRKLVSLNNKFLRLSLTSNDISSLANEVADTRRLCIGNDLKKISILYCDSLTLFSSQIIPLQLVKT